MIARRRLVVGSDSFNHLFRPTSSPSSRHAVCSRPGAGRKTVRGPSAARP